MTELDTATKLPRAAYLIIKHFPKAVAGQDPVTVERAELDTEVKRKDLERATLIIDLAANTVVASRYPQLGNEALLYTYRNKYAEQVTEFLAELGIPDPVLAAGETPVKTAEK